MPASPHFITSEVDRWRERHVLSAPNTDANVTEADERHRHSAQRSKNPARARHARIHDSMRELWSGTKSVFANQHSRLRHTPSTSYRSPDGH